MRRVAIFAIALSAAVAAIAPHTVSANSNILLAATKPVKVAQATETKQETAKTPEAPKPVMVKVVEGDSLSKIAEANNTTWLRIYYANESIANPDVINPGDELRIPTAEEQLAERPLPQPVAPAPVAQAPQRTTSAYRAPTYTAAPSGGSAKDFIYSKESGNNPNAMNAGGCYGIGQDCNGVVQGTCGADYACQDAYFTNYAMQRYGSWEAAQSFWLQNHWW